MVRSLADRTFQPRRELLALPNVVLVAVHDVHRLDARYGDACGTHIARSELERAVGAVPGGWGFFTDAPWYVEDFARGLDRAWNYEDRTNATGSYGPTLGLWALHDPFDTS